MALEMGPEWAKAIDNMHREMLIEEIESSQMWATVLEASAEGRVTIDWTEEDDLRFIVSPKPA